MILAYEHLWGLMAKFAAPFFFTAVSVAVLTPFMILLARRFNILDIPSERKIHTQPVPRLGGLGILIGFWAVSLAHLPWTREFFGIIIGGTIIAVMGIVDDVRSLSSRIRLA